MRILYIFFALLLTSSLSYGQLIINEVLYDPSDADLQGDANGDGTYNQEDDSFIEFFNIGTTNFDASGYEIWDDITDGTLRFVVPDGTIVPPQGALVVFGSSPLVGDFGGAIVLSADTTPSHLNFNNSGEVIGLKNLDGEWELTFDSDALSNNPNESYTRNPDITGEFEQHNENTPLLFSPGTMIDGMPFNTGLAVETISVMGEGGVSEITTNAGTLQMMATTMPDIAADATVIWSVENGTGAAAIDASGLLTAAANGDVTVTAMANDGWGATGSAVITISEQTGIIVTTIDVQGAGGVSEITTAGGELQMEAVVMPMDAVDQSVTWSVLSGTGSATISTGGVLEALTNGVVTVVATANDNSGVTGEATITLSNQDSSIAEWTATSVHIFPNPTTDFISIASSGTIEWIEILAADGKRVETFQGNQSTFNVSNLNPGQYFIRASSNGVIVHKRFIKN